MTTGAGVVLDAAGLDLPGGADQLVLAPRTRAELDQFMHAQPPAPGSTSLDLDALRLACSAEHPRLSTAQARTVLDEWPTGDVEALEGFLASLCPVDAVWAAWWRLELDDTLRLEVGYCAPLGIPRSHFLGGALVWTQADRELAVAWHLRQLAVCPGCHTRPDEWERDPEAYIPDERARDKGCEVIAMTEAQLSEADKEAGAHVVLVPRAQFELLDEQREAEADRLERVKADRAWRLAETGAG